MTKKPKKTAPNKEHRGPRRPLLVWVEVENKKSRLQDVEQAIREKLGTQPTDLFRKTETVVIVVQVEGEGGLSIRMN
jgi:hypothetical protein